MYLVSISRNIAAKGKKVTWIEQKDNFVNIRLRDMFYESRIPKKILENPINVTNILKQSYRYFLPFWKLKQM